MATGGLYQKHTSIVETVRLSVDFYMMFYRLIYGIFIKLLSVKNVVYFFYKETKTYSNYKRDYMCNSVVFWDFFKWEFW